MYEFNDCIIVNSSQQFATFSCFARAWDKLVSLFLQRKYHKLKESFAQQMTFKYFINYEKTN